MASRRWTSAENIVFGDVVRRRFRRVAIKHVLGQARRQEARHIVEIAGSVTRLAPSDGHTSFGIDARQFGGQVQIKELIGQRASIRSGVSWSDCEDFKRACPVQREFHFKDLRVGVGVTRLGALTNRGGRSVNPNPAIFGVLRALVQSVRDCGVLALDFEDVQLVLLANGAVRSLSAFGSKVVMFELIPCKALVSPA